MAGLLGDTVPSETPPTVAPSYGDIFRQMLGMAVGGPISTLNYAARGLTGDLLFPMERTTRYRNYLQQQQQLPGTDVVPVNQQQSQAAAPVAQAGAVQSGPSDILRYLGGFVAPNLTSLMSGQGPPPVANFPAEPGKVPSVDPRMMGAGFELPGLVPGPGELAGLGVAGAKAMGAAAPAALRFWLPETARAAEAATPGIGRAMGAEIAPATRAGVEAPMPQWAEQYPPIGEAVMKPKEGKPGVFFKSKGYSPEGQALMDAREQITEAMKQGYSPYYDPAQRSPVDPSGYPPANVDTLTVGPVQQKTIDSYLQTINAPQTREALRGAYQRGLDLGNANNWYSMGQLEHDFIKELGPEKGKEAFLNRFAAPMAATTSGNNPTQNLLAAHYLNYLSNKGLPMPQGAWDTPAAVGGRRFAVNVRDYQGAVGRGGEQGMYAGLTGDQPKMHNFSRNFIGDVSRATMDEQMAGGMLAHGPPGFSEKARTGAYGLLEAPLHAEAAAAGVAPANYQDVAWAGFKGEPGKPMISHVNDAIERTSRLTGMPREEVVRRGLIRGEIPLYGVGGLMGLGVTAQQPLPWPVPPLKPEDVGPPSFPAGPAPSHWSGGWRPPWQQK